MTEPGIAGRLRTRGRSGGDGTAFSRPGRALCALFAMAVLLGGCRDDESVLERGDRLWADSLYTEALAEYRLGYERNRSVDVLARVAHAFAVTGQFERAREMYDSLLARDPDYTDQAIFDYLDLARRAQERSDRYGLAGAVEAALSLRPGLPVGAMAGPLARYYAAAGETDRARDFFERALGVAPPDSMPALLFDFAQFLESRGNCAEAIELFNAFRTREPRGDRADQARWNVGNCALVLAREARQAQNPERALSYLTVIIELGVPRNLLDQAWFERGEILLETGRRDEALEAYIRALEHAPNAGGQLAERTRRRIDELRFGRTSAASGMAAPRVAQHIPGTTYETRSPATCRYGARDSS